MVTPDAEITDLSVNGVNARRPSKPRPSRPRAIEPSSGATRYFLAKGTNDDGIPAFDREVMTEGEVLVEALRLGITYYTVQEFRAVPDFSGSRPQLTKEAVAAK